MSLYDRDILSESGKVQTLWESYTKESLKGYEPIIMEATSQLVNHLTLSDNECMPTIRKLHSFVTECTSHGIHNPYMEFMVSLNESLSDYLVDFENLSNKHYNMSDKILESSCDTDLKIAYAMLESGLLDSNEVQSLLDNQNLALSATANDLMVRCGRGELPSKGRRDVREASLLKLEDFGTDTERILSCVETFVTEGVDLFPNSPSEVSKMIFPREDFDPQVLYRQDNYISNVANYDILSATAKYIESSFDLDRETSIHVLLTLISQLHGFINKYDKRVCLVLYMATLMVLQKTLTSGGIEDAHLEESIKKELLNSFSMYCKDSDGNQNTNRIRIPQELKDFVTNAEYDDELPMDLDASVEEILSSMREIESIMSYYGFDESDLPDVGEGGAASITESSLQVEHGDKAAPMTYVEVASKESEKLHSILNQSLMEGNFDDATRTIALEIALLEQLDTMGMESANFESDEHLSSIKRDVATYQGMVEASLKENSNYLDTARTSIRETLSLKNII